jgi:ubiquinone/menaquinone biosynthesis C-methylase UbiE
MSEDKANKDVWASGAAYEPYVGRWSRLVAREFLAWLNMPEGREWLDVGCGTGALSRTILETVSPSQVKGIDPSEGFVQFARDHILDKRATFDVGDARSLPDKDEVYGVAVSGLVLNFVPQPGAMVAEMARVVRPGGTVALYVWDYAGKMEMIRYFFDAAVALNPEAVEFDEGARFPVCKPEALQALFEKAGFAEVETRPIDAPTHFRDFDDYWTPFLSGQAPAPRYAMSLTEERRAELRDYLRGHLPLKADGSIELIARAWAVRGNK